ncbi:hypothetical protein V8G54_022698 [Vigna mungo]
MSGYLRRAFSYRNMLWVRASRVVCARDVSSVQMCDSSRVFTIPAEHNFFAESRRAYAKGRKSMAVTLGFSHYCGVYWKNGLVAIDSDTPFEDVFVTTSPWFLVVSVSILVARCREDVAIVSISFDQLLWVLTFVEFSLQNLFLGGQALSLIISGLYILGDEGGVSTIEVPPNVGPTIKANAVSQMEAAMAALSAELSKLRTGRASPGMLDHIIVETSGLKMPLNRLAVVSVLDPKTLSVNPYDPETLKQLENAIVSSPLGLNPKSDGERLIAVIPPLTKEHMQAMTKLVAKSCEDARQSIRRARQKAMDAIKKLYSSLPKDDIKRLEKEVDDLTKKFIKTAEDVCKAKEKEVSQG